MFDIGFFELFVIAVVALIVLGPEKMPHALRMCAAYWGRIKRNLLETKLELEEQLAMEEIRRQLKEEQAKVQTLIDQQDAQEQKQPTPVQQEQLKQEESKELPKETADAKKD